MWMSVSYHETLIQVLVVFTTINVGYHLTYPHHTSSGAWVSQRFSGNSLVLARFKYHEVHVNIFVPMDVIRGKFINSEDMSSL